MFGGLKTIIRQINDIVYVERKPRCSPESKSATKEWPYSNTAEFIRDLRQSLRDSEEQRQNQALNDYEP